MSSMFVRLLTCAQRWLGWEWAVIVVQRDGDVRTSMLRDDVAVSVRPNTDGSLGITIGHEDDGTALLAELRTMLG